MGLGIRLPPHCRLFLLTMVVDLSAEVILCVVKQCLLTAEHYLFTVKLDLLTAEAMLRGEVVLALRCVEVILYSLQVMLHNAQLPFSTSIAH